MSITEKMMEAIDEVLDEKEKEMILICLDDDTFGDTFAGIRGGYVDFRTKTMIFKKYHKRTTTYHIRMKIKSAFDKLEKSPQLRAINAFSP